MVKFHQANAKTVLPVQANSRNCPSCGSSYLERVQRRIIDRVIGIAIPLKRYHCGSCGWEGNLRFKVD